MNIILGTAATIFTTKADLQAAVQAYDANSTDAIATYGAIANSTVHHTSWCTKVVHMYCTVLQSQKISGYSRGTTDTKYGVSAVPYCSSIYTPVPALSFLNTNLKIYETESRVAQVCLVVLRCRSLKPEHFLCRRPGLVP